MPNIKSAKKRVKTNKRDELRNRSAKSTLRTTLKTTHETITGGDEAATTDVLRSTQALIARTCKRGVMHKNKAARMQSRLAKRVNREKAAQG